MSAAKELEHLVADLSMEDAHRELQRVKEAVKDLGDSEQPVHRDDTRTVSAPQSPSVGQMQSMREASSQDHQSLPFSLFIEHLVNLNCYRVTFGARTATDDIELELRSDHDDTLLSIQTAKGESKAVIQLSGIVDPASVTCTMSGTGCTYRLPYRSTTGAESLPALPQYTPSALACRHCQTPIAPFLEACSILPSSRWDEITDYIICYPGQPSMDFGPPKAQPSRVFYDDTHLVLHRSNISNVCAHSHFPAYGEDTRLGDDGAKEVAPELRMMDRSRYAPVVSGVTMACACCASPLGEAPPELDNTVRFLRHQVTSERSISEFMVCELIRYAETRAVYSFVVSTHQPSSFCLHLTLTSWDTLVCESDAVEFVDDDRCGFFRCRWQRLGKILFEERVDSNTTTVTDNMWAWTVDPCCPPSVSSAESVASASSGSCRLVLFPDDYSTLKDELTKKSIVYDSDVVEATALAQLGRSDGASLLAAVRIP